MSYRIFLAGASGVIGRRLVPLLAGAGHHVVGMGRSPKRASELPALGAEYVAVDVFEGDAVAEAIITARPDIVIHQLTDLPDTLDPGLMNEAIIGNARIREEGTRNLVNGAIAAGARRLIAQSIAWAYAPGTAPYYETDALDINAQGNRAITIRGILALENQVLNAPAIEGVVLRYGQLYGPGTSRNMPCGTSPLHADAAAYAALCALDHEEFGVFNIAEPGGEVVIQKAVDRLGWCADFRLATANAGTK